MEYPFTLRSFWFKLAAADKYVNDAQYRAWRDETFDAIWEAADAAGGVYAVTMDQLRDECSMYPLRRAQIPAGDIALIAAYLIEQGMGAMSLPRRPSSTAVLYILGTPAARTLHRTARAGRDGLLAGRRGEVLVHFEFRLEVLGDRAPPRNRAVE